MFLQVTNFRISGSTQYSDEPSNGSGNACPRDDAAVP